MPDQSGRGDVGRRLFDHPALNVAMIHSSLLPEVCFELVDSSMITPDEAAHLHKIDRSDLMPTDPKERPIKRNELRAFDPKITEFILHAVNTAQFSYRTTRNSVILYPTDESANVTVYARNSDRQLRSLRQWFAKHDPDHPLPDPDTTQPAAESIPTPAEIHVQPVNVVPDRAPDPDDEHWSTYMDSNGEPIERFETDGAWVRCRECRDTDTEWIGFGGTGVGGHTRMRHTDTASLFTEEARAKALDSRRYNALARHVEHAVAELSKALGKTDSDRRIAELEQALATMTAERDEYKARLDLIREAYGA